MGEWAFRSPACAPDEPVVVFAPLVMQGIDLLTRSVNAPVHWFSPVTCAGSVLLVQNIKIPVQRAGDTSADAVAQLLAAAQADGSVLLWGRTCMGPAHATDQDDEVLEAIASGPHFIRVLSGTHSDISVSVVIRQGRDTKFIYDARHTVGFGDVPTTERRAVLKAVQDSVKSRNGRKAVKVKREDGSVLFELD